MPSLDLLALLGVARRVMDEAVMLAVHRQRGEVHSKGDRDLVTDIELEIETLVRERLREHSSEIGFLGEETGVTGSREVYWVLDPIDGTANFVHGMPLCAVALGLIQHDQPVLGVIDLPFIGHRYWAARGHGAFRDGDPITSSDTSAIEEAMVSVSDYGSGEGGSDRNRISFELDRALTERAQRVRRLGSSAIDLVWVADGTLDASLTLGNRSWDTAAGAIIAREAGAIVVDADGSQHSVSSRCIIATAPNLGENLLSLLHILRGTIYWPTSATAATTDEPGDHGQTMERQVGQTAFLATIGMGVGNDDTVDTVAEAELATIEDARSWVERTLPSARFPDWVNLQPHGSAGAFLFGSIQKGRYVAVPDDVSWEPEVNDADNLDAKLVDGRVHWRGAPDTVV